MYPDDDNKYDTASVESASSVQKGSEDRSSQDESKYGSSQQDQSVARDINFGNIFDENDDRVYAVSADSSGDKGSKDKSSKDESKDRSWDKSSKDKSKDGSWDKSSKDKSKDRSWDKSSKDESKDRSSEQDQPVARKLDFGNYFDRVEQLRAMSAGQSAYESGSTRTYKAAAMKLLEPDPGYVDESPSVESIKEPVAMEALIERRLSEAFDTTSDADITANKA